MSGRAAAFLVAGLGALAALGAWRLDADADAERRAAAVEASRIRSWARSEGGAGISVVPKRVPVLDRDRIRDLEGRPGFHAYAMRCSSCHELPDPAAYPPGTWADKVEEMRRHAAREGLMPPTDEELAEVRAFLSAASAAARTAP